MWTNEPLDDFHRHDAMQSAELSRCPICDCCDEPIQEDYYFETEEGMFCEECFEEKVVEAFRDKHKRSIDY